MMINPDWKNCVMENTKKCAYDFAINPKFLPLFVLIYKYKNTVYALSHVARKYSPYIFFNDNIS